MDIASSQSRELMLEFARQTGLFGGSALQTRYLWTDAFAVCNFLSLHKHTGDKQFLDLALLLVDQVHLILGRHREDDMRTGWISGLDEENGRLHPTRGGLRIGKKLGERLANDAYDEQLEWDRDGQYFHYLTKWMHALSRVSRVTGDECYRTWAIELARAVLPHFTYISPVDGREYMRWKMSIDLSRPLVPAMGQHDPLDGLITYHELLRDEGGETGLDLHDELNELSAICRGLSWSTDDPLGLGGILADAYRVAQMMDQGWLNIPQLFTDLLADSVEGMQSFVHSNTLNLPPEYRLAFRELGLAIGLHSVSRMQVLFDTSHKLSDIPGISSQLRKLAGHLSLAEKIENFWLIPENQTAPSWNDHREINAVMLATSLLPDDFLLV